MSERMILCGFSLAQMRRLFGSGDERAVRRIRDRLAAENPYWRPDEHEAVGAIVERAIMRGVPFGDLSQESYLHQLAAGAMASDEQEWLVITMASTYGASALRDGLWRSWRKYAGPEARILLRGLVEGVPLFGSQTPPDGVVYAAISLEKLRFFRKGIVDFREQIVYRVGRKKDPTEDDRASAEFVTDFCDWLEQIEDAGRDLWFTGG